MYRIPVLLPGQYPYPTGDLPVGANCLSECEYRPPVSYSDQLQRGVGPAPLVQPGAG